MSNRLYTEKRVCVMSNMFRYIKLNVQSIVGIVQKRIMALFIINACFTITISVLSPFTARFMEELVDHLAYQPVLLSALIKPIIGMALVSLIIEVVENIQQHIDKKMDLAVSLSISNKIHEILSVIKLEEFENSYNHDLFERVFDKVTNGIKQILSSSLLLLSPVLMIMTYSILLLSVQWYYPFIIAVGSLPYAYVLNRQNRLEYTQHIKLSNKRRKAQCYSEMLDNRQYAKENRVFRTKQFLIKKYLFTFEAIFSDEIGLKKTIARYDLLAQVCRHLSFGACLIDVLIRVMSGQVQIGTFVMAYVAVNSLNSSFSNLITNISNYDDFSVNMEDWNKLMHLPCEEPSDKNVSALADIDFRNVTFKYPHSNKNAIESINVTLYLGQKILLIGDNGSGKTTFLSLLMGLYTPISGTINFAGVSIQNILHGYRARISAIFQNYIRYQLSIADNVLLGHQVEVNGLTRTLLANSAFLRLDNGMNTLLGQLDKQAIELSGGMWQRVALGRMFCRDADILVMDEPTANLDPNTENMIVSALCNVDHTKTVVIASHRLAYANMVDRVLVFANGRIVADGTHDVLYKSNSNYRHMYDLQKIAIDEVE